MAFRLLMMKAPASLGVRSLSLGLVRPKTGLTFSAATRLRTRASTIAGTAQRRFNSSSSNSGGSRQHSSGRSNKRSGGFSYSAYLESHPIMTKSITSMFVVGSGDLLCQKFIEERETVQWKRVATMGWIGLTLAGPLLHQWFGFLFRFIPGIGPAAIAKKIAMDQLMFGPLFNPLFMGYIFLLEGRPEAIVDFMKNDWLTVTMNNWKLWTPAQIINFVFVPAQFQVLFANFTGVIWNCYISWKAHQSAHHDDDEDGAVVVEVPVADAVVKVVSAQAETPASQ